MPDFSRLATRVRGLSRVEKNFAQRGCSAWADLCRPRHLLISVPRLFFVCVLQLFVLFLEADIARGLRLPNFFTTAHNILLCSNCDCMYCFEMPPAFSILPLASACRILGYRRLIHASKFADIHRSPLGFPDTVCGRSRACVRVCVCV